MPAADYAEALHQLKLVRNAIAPVLDDVDVLVTPTLPRLPIRIEEARESPNEATGILVRNPAPFNNYGIPAILRPLRTQPGRSAHRRAARWPRPGRSGSSSSR